MGVAGFKSKETDLRGPDRNPQMQNIWPELATPICDEGGKVFRHHDVVAALHGKDAA